MQAYKVHIPELINDQEIVYANSKEQALQIAIRRILSVKRSVYYSQKLYKWPFFAPLSDAVQRSQLYSVIENDPQPIIKSKTPAPAINPQLTLPFEDKLKSL